MVMGTVPDTAKEPPPDASEKIRSAPYQHLGPLLIVAAVDVEVVDVVAMPAARTRSNEEEAGPSVAPTSV
jgi:hypothetical protein